MLAGRAATLGREGEVRARAEGERCGAAVSVGAAASTGSRSRLVRVRVVRATAQTVMRRGSAVQ